MFFLIPFKYVRVTALKKTHTLFDGFTSNTRDIFRVAQNFLSPEGLLLPTLFNFLILVSEKHPTASAVHRVDRIRSIQKQPERNHQTCTL